MNLKIEHHIRKVEESDREWIHKVLIESWGSSRVVTKGTLHQADGLPGFVAVVDGHNAGFLTYNVSQNMFEIVTLNVIRQREGVGRSLVQTVVEEARSLGCSRIWVITTNDNTPAVKFYEAMGFSIARIHKDSIRESRKLKPEIPELGVDGIPITDEIELEMNFEQNTYL